MKVLTRTLLTIFFSGFCLILSSQMTGKHSIGIQLNPYFDEALFKQISVKPVYALRYSYRINEHITIGPELSGYFAKVLNDDFTFGNFNAGGFFRYSFLPSARIRPFIELSPYYTYHYWKNFPEIAYSDQEPNGNMSFISGYAAPGISLFSKSGKISLDLFYKFSNKTFVNNNQSVFSYRLNFNF